MNALVRKEIRLILPGWIGAIILAVAPMWFVPRTELALWRKGDSGYWMLSIWVAFGLLWPALSSFGQEFNLGTFSTLLAQPIDRARVWRLKLGTLTFAAAVALAAALISFCCRFGGDPSIWQFALSSLLLILVSLSGGWWTTLLLRQVAPSFLFAVFIPFLITISTIGLLLGNVSNEAGMACLMTLLALYAVAGFVAARRLFWNAQDAAWLGQLISPPQLFSRAAARNTDLRTHKRNPFLALLGKEIQLQQVTFILAAAMAVIHLADLAARRFGVGYLSGNPMMRGILEVVPFLWLLLPMVAGSAMVAEERKLGTLEGQLCAPISRRWQYALKTAIALSIGFLLGGVMPNVLEGLGHMAGVVGGTDQLTVIRYMEPTSMILLCSAFGLSVAAFYASTLSRNTLQALGMSIVLSIIFYLFIGIAIVVPGFDGRPLWGTPLAICIGGPVGILTTLGLGWSNYGHLHFGAKVWRRNVLTLLVAWVLTVGADSLIYNRVWEIWMPEEPGHEWFGMEKPTAQPVKIAYGDGKIAVVSDGRLWLEDNDHRGRFVDGLDWKQAAVSMSSIYAMKRDGSLWDMTTTSKPVQLESRWRDIVAEERAFVGLKTDGSIWTWGKRWTRQGEKEIELQQVGSDTNWELIAASVDSAVAVQHGGAIWRWDMSPSPHEATNEWRFHRYWAKKLPGHDIIELSYRFGTIYALADDKTLWACSQEMGLQQMGLDADWASAQVASWGSAVAIKTNGTLWRIETPRTASGFQQQRISPYQLWASIAWGGFVQSLSGDHNSMLALSKDGMLCRWRTPYNFEWGGEQPQRDDLLAPSRLKAIKVADLTFPSN